MFYVVCCLLVFDVVSALLSFVVVCCFVRRRCFAVRCLLSGAVYVLFGV